MGRFPTIGIKSIPPSSRQLRDCDPFYISGSIEITIYFSEFQVEITIKAALLSNGAEIAIKFISACSNVDDLTVSTL